jgi:hypothetical protein
MISAEDAVALFAMVSVPPKERSAP